MKLTRSQNRFINNKSMGVAFLKGKRNSGKTTASIYRAINLENNYCLFEDDKILYLTLNNDRANHIKKRYSELKRQNHFYSLFSSDKDKVNIVSLPELILDYSNRYKNSLNLELEYKIRESLSDVIFNDDFKEVINRYGKKSKLIRNSSYDDILDEILWIKSSNLSFDEYMECDRRGRKKRIRKNSTSREMMYSLMNMYNASMKKNKYMDKYDRISFAKEFCKAVNDRFAHIIVDGGESISRGELQLINELYDSSKSSSMTLLINTDESYNSDSWFVKGRKTVYLENEYKNKTYILKGAASSAAVEKIEDRRKNYMEKYRYINLRHRSEFDFNIDNLSSSKEIYLDNDIVFKEDELKEVPVFNQIAAGNPIEINDEIKENFYLPSGWLEKGKDTFILEVKGDSMIDKNIYNGDLVVIKKQHMAYNNDIVAAALDGEATLKILNTNDKYPKLMPANSRYSAINLTDKEVSILGVAIGIIKHHN